MLDANMFPSFQKIEMKRKKFRMWHEFDDHPWRRICCHT